MKRLAAALALLTCLGVTACATSRAPNLTDRAERWRQVDTYEIDPPLIYYRWWLETKECLGVEEPPVPFEEIRFMIRVDLILYGRTLGQVSDSDGPPYDLRPHAQERARERGEGPVTPTVWLAAPYSRDEDLVAHELAHVLLGVGGHPDPPFGTCVVAPGSNEHTWEPPRL